MYINQSLEVPSFGNLHVGAEPGLHHSAVSLCRLLEDTWLLLYSTVLQ